MLGALPLFSGVAQADLEALAQDCHRLAATKDQTLFSQDDPTDCVWMVKSGQVKIVFHDVDGREVILEMISPGEVFGGAVLFFPKQPATARAADDAELLCLGKDAYARFISTHPTVALKLIRMLGQRQFGLIRTQTLIGERVERRMAHILLKLADRVGRVSDEGTLITISLSRQDLADMSGTTLETAIRTLSRFSSEGLLRTERGGFLFIRDRAGLETIARSA